MRLNDIKLDTPDQTLPVGPTGDLVLVAGIDSLELTMQRAIATVPGTLLHRPTFGGGVERYLGRLSSVGSAAAAAKAMLEADRRVERCQVSAEMRTPGQLMMWAEVVTVDAEASTITLLEP